MSTHRPSAGGITCRREQIFIASSLPQNEVIFSEKGSECDEVKEDDKDRLLHEAVGGHKQAHTYSEAVKIKIK